MRDGLLRRVIKALARWQYQANLAVTRAVLQWRGMAPYELGGTCGQCAQCCEAPGIQVGRVTWYFPTVKRIFIAWQRRINGFVLTGQDVGSRVLIFNCTHFDKDTRRCDSYESRPGMCRDYPRALLFQTAPDFMPGCGYRPVARGAEKLLQILDGEPMTDAQRETLKRKLHLEK